MISYKFGKALPDKRKTLLVPVSGGISSVVLLYILDEHLKRQRAQSQDRTSYDLHVLTVDTSSAAAGGPFSSFAESLQKRFPSHMYSFEPLSAVFTFDLNVYKALEQLGLAFSPSPGKADHETSLQGLFSRLGSSTARTDIQSILLNRLVGGFSQQHGYEAVLWGQSNSKLAATALSSVAKGRGGSVPMQIGDDPSPWGPIFHYPVRDLFKPELELYARLIQPSLSDLIIWDRDNMATNVSVKNSAIDDLLTAYITSQGERYPSIMANVVRTSSKLQMPKLTDGNIPCSFCGTSITSDLESSSRNSNPLSSDSYRDLCYGCSRLKQDILTS